MQRRKPTTRIAQWSTTHRKLAIFGWLAFVVAAVAIGGSIGTKTLDGADLSTGEAQRAERALERAELKPNTELVLVQNSELSAGDQQFAAVVGEVTTGLESTRYVENVSSPSNGGGAVSEDGHSALVEFEIAGDSTQAETRVNRSLAAVNAVRRANPGYSVRQFGDASASKAINQVFADDLRQAETLSLPITLIILVIAFGSLVAAGVPLLLAISAVAATIGLVAIPSQFFPVDESLTSVILLIGLAVGVDYSLFYLRREREERAAGKSPDDALATAAVTSGKAILVSGLTVMVAMAGLLITGDSTFISFAIGTIMVVGVAMFASLTILPALLSWLGDRVEKGRIPFTKKLRRPAGESRFWAGLVARVMRRPVVSIAVAGGALLVLAVPGIGLNTVVTGPSDFPQDLPVVKTYNQVQEAFPSEGSQSSVVVEAADVKSGEVATGIDNLVRKADRSDLLIPGATVTYSDDGTVADVAIPTPGEGTDASSAAALAEIRDDLVPATVGAVDGVVVNVSGNAAESHDYNQLLSQRMPLVFAFVLGLAFLLMLITFRSIVIPLKAIALNLLSVGAAYGMLALIFQHGWGESLLGFQSNGGVTTWLPLFMFVILFGLSMDYHVFILSRVREYHNRGMSTDEAVRKGIATTAGTVTSAAVVMVAVFAIFATLSIIDMKEMGVGLAFAVLIDATIIRGVLLPASMKLLGERNWYLPAWLDRRLPGGDRAGSVAGGESGPVTDPAPATRPGPAGTSPGAASTEAPVTATTRVESREVSRV
ncbi:MAG: MMPL family transporter [Solirubrobacterales bacterium]|nr:MMPL family transporter [Solirubrobacterales bacterium]